MVEAESFGQWLRHRRRELDLTQDELARRIGCAPITVRKIEADQMRPSKQLATLLCEQLAVTVDEREHFVRFARGGEAVHPVALAAPRDNIPHPISSFIGREGEIAEVKCLVSVTRLVTLTGAGGCGKSRLAMETASQMLDCFRDGVWFAAFAPLSDPALVHQTIASALRVREDPGRALIETLCTYLVSKQLLLIFDNCEHLIGECAQTANTLLQACPQLRILATSREALEIPGEAQYYVPSLSLPEAGAAISAQTLNQSEAVRLFVDRGALVQPTFGLTAANSSSVAQICRRLDGMPLAIELAAARVKVLNVQHIAEYLDDRFNLLTSGNRTASPRHQTLRATIEWSYELLPERTRVLFRRLSVFAGGFTQETARTICSGDGLALVDVLAELCRLVDRSLVERVQGCNEERYRMLETIRAYAVERLQESGEEERLRGRHLTYFTDWAEELEPKLRGPEQIECWNKMEIEHDNIRAALGWSLSGGNAQHGLRLAGAANWFWQARYHSREALKWLKSTLAQTPTQQRTSARAKALVNAAISSMDECSADPANADPADHWLKEALGIFRELDDKWWISYALIMLAWYRLSAAEADSARSLFEESLAFAHETNDEWIVGSALLGLGAAVERADYVAALPILEESLLHLKAAGDRWMIAHELRQMTTVAMGLHDYARAASLAEEALKLYAATGDEAGKPEMPGALAMALLGLGYPERAAGACRESLRLAESIGYTSQVGGTLRYLGCIACVEDQPRRAAILLAAGESLLNSIGITIAMSPWDYPVYEQSMASAQSRLGQAEFNQATAEGQAMTQERAVHYALGDIKEDEWVPH